MSDESTEPAHGRDGFAVSIVRNVVGALVLVVLSAGVFWAIGSFGGEDDAIEVADAPEPEPVEQPEDDADPGEAEDATEAEDEPVETDDPADDADTDADQDEATDEDAGADQDEATDEDGATDEADDGDRLDPGSITVQVLDGYQADGGTAATATAEELRDLGYQVVAENPAIRYDVTTVLYTGDAVAEGEQIAQDLGAADVRQQSGLSTAVQVHVVVGADRG